LQNAFRVEQFVKMILSSIFENVQKQDLNQNRAQQQNRSKKLSCKIPSNKVDKKTVQ
jgi:hypothetical protein